jgi:hypothetical protein
LREPLNELERDADPQGIWRAYCNHALADYAPLWERIDRLLFLQGPGFEVVPDWRWQQEVTLQAAHPRRSAMLRGTVERFVLFFERVSRQALRTLPPIAQSGSMRCDVRSTLLDDKSHPQIDAPFLDAAVVAGDDLDLVDPRALDVFHAFGAFGEASLDRVFHAFGG